MISMEMLEQRWSSIVPQKGKSIARRADPSHPLDFFVGYSEDQRMQLLLIADAVPQLPASSKQIIINARQRSDGKYAICFTLQTFSLRDTFIPLCWDIINCTSDAYSPSAGIETAIRRFGIWMIMLAKGHDKGLSKESAKGLLGELIVLNNYCIPKYGANKAINGWLGPLRADRDFEYEDIWVEVKTVSSEADTVSISSYDQLDIDQKGVLLVQRLDKSSITDTAGTSLRIMIEKILEAVAGNENASAILRTRLMLSGYRDDDPTIDDMYLDNGNAKYLVSDGFPRIRKRQIPEEIVNGTYSLDIDALSPWKEI